MSLGVSKISEAFTYWNNLLCMKQYSRTDDNLVVGYGDNQVCLIQLVIKKFHFDITSLFSFFCRCIGALG